MGRRKGGEENAQGETRCVELGAEQRRWDINSGILGTCAWVERHGFRSPIPGCTERCEYAPDHLVLKHDLCCRACEVEGQFCLRSGRALGNVHDGSLSIGASDCGVETCVCHTCLRTVFADCLQKSNVQLPEIGPPFRTPIGGGRRRRWALRISGEQGDATRSAAQEGGDRQDVTATLSAITEDQGEDGWSDLNRKIFGPLSGLAARAPEPVGLGVGARWFDQAVAPIFDMDEGHEQTELLGMSEYATLHGDWIRVSSVVDSGACAPVCPLGMVPGYPYRENRASKEGKTFSAASGHAIRRHGEQELHAVTDNGLPTEILFQVADVECPLVSVSAVCDNGNRVIFGRAGGVIQNVQTGAEVPFERRGGVYALGLWVRKPRAEAGAAAVAAVSPFGRR